ncbi:MAG: phospholipase [Acidobacteria bacterium]|nr:phospholipase [Acidobacteriota bacterium]
MSRDREQEKNDRAAREGRLAARPKKQIVETGPAGLQPLGLEGQRDGLLYVPAQYRAEHPAPLALMLHGAGGDAQGGMSMLQSFADETGIILLAPASRGRTWDIILGAYGPDVSVVNRALEQTFARYAVDHKRVAVGGFSDGASYALSLGIINGDLFTHVLAFSPGLAAAAVRHGLPRFFVSHGKRDRVLPIDSCSRRLVPQLAQAGYDVRYREFDGPHTVPPEIARGAVEWFTGKRAKPQSKLTQ